MVVKESQAVPRAGQVVTRVGPAVQDPGDDPGEEGQQVQRCDGVHKEKPFAVEFLAVKKSAVKKRRQDQDGRNHKEENWKFVRRKDPTSREGRKHKYKERRRGRKQKSSTRRRRRDRQEMKRQAGDEKQAEEEKGCGHVDEQAGEEEEKRGKREKKAAVPSKGKAHSEKRQM